MEQKMEDWKAKQAARESMVAALRAANPGLVPANGKGGSLIAAAKNMRIELAAAYPGVKFSIKSRRFSGGDAIDVRWTDGPTGKQVDAIIGRYVSGSFDSMTDCAGVVSSRWMDAFGDARFVSGARDYSDALIASVARLVCSRYGIDMAKFPTDGIVAAYRAGMLRSIKPASWFSYDLGDLIYQEAARRCCAIPKKLPAGVASEKEVA